MPILKPVLLTLFLLAAGSSHAHGAEVSLICDPDAIVSFESKLILADTIRFESDDTFEIPWTGKEATVSGRALKAKFSHADTDSLADDSSFRTFRGEENTLHVDRALFSRDEQGGVVIIESNSPQVYHCRRL